MRSFFLSHFVCACVHFWDSSPLHFTLWNPHARTHTHIQFISFYGRIRIRIHPVCKAIATHSLFTPPTTFISLSANRRTIVRDNSQFVMQTNLLESFSTHKVHSQSLAKKGNTQKEKLELNVLSYCADLRAPATQIHILKFYRLHSAHHPLTADHLKISRWFNNIMCTM